MEGPGEHWWGNARFIASAAGLAIAAVVTVIHHLIGG